jgi:hypothetical protein
MAMTDTFQLSSSSQGVEKVDGRASPSRQFCDEYHIDLPGLCERHDLSPLGTVELRAGACLPEYRSHLVTGSVSESSQVTLLPLA